jgi:hypothetical protein
MFPKLQFDERWLADQERYQTEISAITNEELKLELTEILVKLQTQVEYIDQHHEQIFVTGKLPGETDQLRSNIGMYRTTLDERIADWKRSQIPL